MRCVDVQARLSEYLDTQLSEQEQGLLLLHLQGCHSCQAVERTLRTTNELIAAAATSSDVADEPYFSALQQQIMLRLGEEGRGLPEEGDLFAYDAASMPRLDSSESAGFPIPVFLLRRRESARQDLQSLIQNKRGMLLSSESGAKTLEAKKQSAPEPSALIAVPRDAETKRLSSSRRGRRLFFAVGTLLLLVFLFWASTNPSPTVPRGELLSLSSLSAVATPEKPAAMPPLDLTWEQITSVLEGFSPQSCVSKGQGTVMLRLSIAESGKVLSAETEETPLAMCLSSLVMQLRFPTSSRVQRLVVPVVVAK